METANIRNLALAGHSSSGKTSLAEAMLFVSGALTRQTKADEGYKITLSTSLLHTCWKNKKINFLDTPGYADFFGEVVTAIAACESAVIVVDAIAGAKVQTKRVANLAADKGLSSLYFINRLDKEHAKFNEIIEEIQNLNSANAIAAFLPIGLESNFKGVIDLITLKAYEFEGKEAKPIEIPADLQQEAVSGREKLMDAAAENEDSLLEKYLESGSLEVDEIIQGLKKGISDGKTNLIFCGSASKNIGISLFMDYINELCPSPLKNSRPEEPFSGLIFKTISDPYVGKLSFIKVFSGNLKKDQSIVNLQKNTKTKVAHIYEVQSKEEKEISELVTGDIGAIPKLEGANTSDTIAADAKQEKYDLIKLPESVLSFAIDPKSKGDEEKLGVCLAKLTIEDPTLIVKHDTQTKETVISGMGDMHLEVVLNKLKERFGVEAIMHAPKIPYRETIKGSAKSQGKHKKQTGGHGQYGDVWLRLEPLQRGRQFEFLNEIKGGVVPAGYIPAVEKGVLETMEHGVLAGYPVVDVKVALYDGSYHPVDSSEMAFKMAASIAFKEAFMQSNPVLLEPIMHIEAHLPEQYVGDVISNLSSKRGRILGTQASGKYHVVTAEAPLEEISKYAIELRSITHGEGDFTMHFSHYEEMPPDQARKLISTV